MRCSKAILFGIVMFVGVGGGCMRPADSGKWVNRFPIKQRALAVLQAAVTYQANPAVRLSAVEALETSGCPEGLPWIRGALSDAHPGVRFAACVALGNLHDTTMEDQLRARVEDEDVGVRLAAMYALHKLGHTELTGRMPTYLLSDDDVMVRRNAAMLLGMLGAPSAVKALARAMRDTDPGVRQDALEGMARLGTPEAKQELAFMANSGVGSEEVFAINALSATGDPAYVDTFRYKLATAAHLETKLAAAAALGRQGFDDGLAEARRALRIKHAVHDDPDDPPAAQMLRIKLLAAAALGAIGKLDTLSELTPVMEDSGDPRVQVAAARAVLQILAADRAEGLPFAASGREGG